MGEHRHRRPVGGPGFTLLELVVTLMVLALALAVVGPSIGRSTETIRARTQVARFAALLRHTREQAITSRRPHTLAVDPVAHQVNIVVGDEVRESRPLPDYLGVEAEPPSGLTVRFEPHGTSNGGTFRVTSGDVHYRVTVDPLTGRVRIDRQ
jgi:prepilin-type N-terminal cleavage/methylation domain-containing protein